MEAVGIIVVLVIDDAWDILKIKAGDTDVYSGKLEISR